MDYGKNIYNEKSLTCLKPKVFYRNCWNWGNVFWYYWCGLYYRWLFLMCLSDSLTFSVYMNIFKRCFVHFLKNVQSVNNVRTIYTGIFGGKYYWYFRR